MKRETIPSPPGIISNLLHDKYPIKSTVLLSNPTGEFFVSTDVTGPIVLISGGIGATPMMSILNDLAAKGFGARKVTWVQSVKKRKDLVFGKRIEALVQDFPDSLRAATFFTDESVSVEKDEAGVYTGRIDFASSGLPEGVKEMLHLGDETAHYYICGPGPFMTASENGLKNPKCGVDAGRIHMETFVE